MCEKAVSRHFNRREPVERALPANAQLTGRLTLLTSPDLQLRLGCSTKFGAAC